MAVQEKIGARRHVVGAHYGLKDFIAQRITAVILVVYTLVLGIAVLLTPSFTYESWRHLFSFTVYGLPLGQLLATLAFTAVVWHAWIGIRDLWMDYIKSVGLRLFLYVFTILWLAGSVVYAAKILWSI